MKLNAKPSQFKYPEFLKKEENKTKEKVETAVLSTTTKVKARADRKKKDGGDAEMTESGVSVTKQDSETKKPAAAEDSKMDGDEESKKKEGEEEKKDEEEKKEEEPTDATLNNPLRVVK